MTLRPVAKFARGLAFLEDKVVGFRLRHHRAHLVPGVRTGSGVRGVYTEVILQFPTEMMHVDSPRDSGGAAKGVRNPLAPRCLRSPVLHCCWPCGSFESEISKPARAIPTPRNVTWAQEICSRGNLQLQIFLWPQQQFLRGRNEEGGPKTEQVVAGLAELRGVLVEDLLQPLRQPKRHRSFS